MVPSGYLDKKNEVVPLRFAFSTKQALAMKIKLRRFLDVDQFWFQSPVICCPQGPESLGYIPGSCPQAEELSRGIINWPCVFAGDSRKIFLGILQNAFEKE